jgi:IS1 family transposase
MQASCGLEVEIRTEAAECWSARAQKAPQRWTWDAIDRSQGVLVAHQNGRRTDAMGEPLVAQLDMFPIAASDPDEGQSDSTYLPDDQPHIGPKDTWELERSP